MAPGEGGHEERDEHGRSQAGQVTRDQQVDPPARLATAIRPQTPAKTRRNVRTDGRSPVVPVSLVPPSADGSSRASSIGAKPSLPAHRATRIRDGLTSPRNRGSGSPTVRGSRYHDVALRIVVTAASRRTRSSTGYGEDSITGPRRAVASRPFTAAITTQIVPSSAARYKGPGDPGRRREAAGARPVKPFRHL
jgi:hypothetical protein